MKRLSDNAVEIVNELHTEKLAYESEYVPIIDALNRLAEYEDTGLTPKEIEDMVSVREIPPEVEYAIDKHADNLIQQLEQLIAKTDEEIELQRYKDAEDQGFLTWLPCKVGDNVYRLWGCGKHGKSIAEFEVIQISWYDFGIEIAYRKRNSTTGSYYHSKPDDFGKTVFASREEVEKALEEVCKKNI